MHSVRAERSDANDSPTGLQVSLVICTRNRANQLKACLESLTRLRCPVKWELVIVNNASTDDTEAVVEQFRGRLPCILTYAYAAIPGLGRARNVGWRISRGEVISFTDDDCYPEEEFLSAVLRAFEGNQHLGFIGGRILLFDPTDYRITIQEHNRREYLAPRSFIPSGLIQGANMSVRRVAVESVDGFDERFGAGALFPCEDVDIVARISAAGWQGAYEPGPVVYHHHGRKTEADAIRLMKQYDRGRGAYYAKGLLDPVMRVLVLKNWYWGIRSQPYGKTAREIAAACEYWARAGGAAASRFCRLC